MCIRDRAVGGLGDLDTRLRDKIEEGMDGPRILAADYAICVRCV